MTQAKVSEDYFDGGANLNQGSEEGENCLAEIVNNLVDDIVASGGGVHHTQHENGGGDEISVLGLSGLLADQQTPLAHVTRHLPSGNDAVAKSGTATAVGAGDVVVAFGVAYADANYKIALGNIGAADAVVKIGTKALGGFTLTFGAAGDCDWIAIHN